MSRTIRLNDRRAAKAARRQSAALRRERQAKYAGRVLFALLIIGISIPLGGLPMFIMYPDQMGGGGL
jgi:hypothetical protein